MNMSTLAILNSYKHLVDLFLDILCAQTIFVLKLFLVLFVCFDMGQKIISVIPSCYVDAILWNSLRK